MKPVSEPDSRRKSEFEELSEAVKRERRDDGRWFEANPRRTLRVRPAFRNEARRSALLALTAAPPDAVRFVLVRRLRPHGRLVLPFTPPHGWQPPVTEAGARRVWKRLCAEGVTFCGMPLDRALPLIEGTLEAA